MVVAGWNIYLEVLLVCLCLVLSKVTECGTPFDGVDGVRRFVRRIKRGVREARRGGPVDTGEVLQKTVGT